MSLDYIGSELDLFAEATNWKQYLREQIASFIGETVLEVGAGFGGTTATLNQGTSQHWVCVEPDETLAQRAVDAVESGVLPSNVEVVSGTLADIDDAERFETVLYIDVLEHIEQDQLELERAARRLQTGGYLVVLAPAHPWLYSPFDASIGHFRRYTAPLLAGLNPPGVQVVRQRYLDTVGLLASLGNRLLLRQAMPSRQQVLFWDRVLVPLSRRLDPLHGYRVGKSVLVVWQRLQA